MWKKLEGEKDKSALPRFPPKPPSEYRVSSRNSRVIRANGEKRMKDVDQPAAVPAVDQQNPAFAIRGGPRAVAVAARRGAELSIYLNSTGDSSCWYLTSFSGSSFRSRTSVKSRVAGMRRARRRHVNTDDFSDALRPFRGSRLFPRDCSGNAGKSARAESFPRAFAGGAVLHARVNLRASFHALPCRFQARTRSRNISVMRYPFSLSLSFTFAPRSSRMRDTRNLFSRFFRNECLLSGFKPEYLRGLN